MHLTLQSDYALRILMYLALVPDRIVPVAEIASAYKISRHHLLKIQHLLTEQQFVAAIRGRSGGLRLNRQPEDIRIGAVVRATEPNFTLVECFDRRTDTCPITPLCSLKATLEGAVDDFLKHLDGITIADVVNQNRDRLRGRIVRTPRA